mgnify:FL=1
MKSNKLKILFLAICVLQLFYLFHFRSGFKYEIIKNPFGVNSGIDFALTPMVIESKKILKNQKLSTFNVSEVLRNDGYFYQRTIEFNYPIRLKRSSKSIFYLLEENVPENCNILESGNYLKLTQC